MELMLLAGMPSATGGGLCRCLAWSAQAAVGAPDLTGAVGSRSHEFGQHRVVGDGERHVGATSAGHRAAVGLHGEVAVRPHPHVERAEHELLATPGVGPPVRL